MDDVRVHLAAHLHQVGLLEFHDGIDEIFDVQFLPGLKRPPLSGPDALSEGREPIWLVQSPNPQFDVSFVFKQVDMGYIVVLGYLRQGERQ